MSLSDSILIAIGTFVLVIVAMSIIIRIGLGKKVEKLLELRTAQQSNLEATRSQTQESRDRVNQVAQRAQENQAKAELLHQRAQENQDRADRLWDRSEANQDRWEQVLSRIEALVERVEHQGGA